MVRIGLLSDTHSWLDPDVFSYFDSCDEVWHAGDLGSMDVLEKLEEFRTTRAVFGNIDNAQIRSAAPENQIFSLDGLSVVMTHIGGYPGRYNARVKKLLDSHRPDLYICGHSHILKVMPDKKRHLLHINPGACGNHGFHKMRTIVRFAIQAGKITDLEVVELGKRGKL
jgi:uncharacterized protein